MSIKLLSNETIKKIAAGEVVENPYSVVKELVENSIDSGANIIKVEIKNSGKKEIMISDNGCGIEEKEIGLAFTKHATSKLNKFDDIYSILSYGFRGEALASISAVSKIDINTRTKNSDFGIHCYLEDNHIIKKNKIGMNIGTTIYIRDLFYNVPIRKKFLKSDVYESSIITILMYAFAIANQNISFKYIKDSKVVFETNEKNTLKENINQILGTDISKNLIPIDIKDSDYTIYGYLTNNHYYRSNRHYQFLFVNGRYVFDEKIRNIIEKSISSIIPKGKYPAFTLFIELKPDLIDINVHPNKKKIKFVFEDKLINILNKNILDIVLKNTTSDFIISKTEKNNDDFLETFNSTDSESKNEIIFKDDYKSNNIIEKFSYEDLFKVKQEEILTIKEEDNVENYKINEKKLYHPSITEQIVLDKNFVKENKKLLDYKIIGQIFSKYLLLEDKEEIVILDILNAKYRLLYEDLLNQYKNKNINKQLLLFPIILDLNEYEISLFLKVKDKLNILGIDSDIFDDNSIVIRTLPEQLSNLDKEDIRSLIIELIIENKDAFEVKLYKIISKKKISIKEWMSEFEINELVLKLSNINLNLNIFDKKIIRKLSKLDFEKIFFKE